MYTGPAQLPHGGDALDPRRVTERHEEHRDPGSDTDIDAFGAAGQHGAIDAETKSDARQWLPAELGHQAVVAAAAADARLRAEAVVHEFERRLRVVVETAHHARVQRVVHPQCVEVRTHGGEVIGTLGAQVVDDQRRTS